MLHEPETRRPDSYLNRQETKVRSYLERYCRLQTRLVHCEEVRGLEIAVGAPYFTAAAGIGPGRTGLSRIKQRILSNGSSLDSCQITLR